MHRRGAQPKLGELFRMSIIAGKIGIYSTEINVVPLFQRWEGIMRVICIVAWTALLCGGVFVNALAGDRLFPPADRGPIETSDCRYLASQCDYGLVAR